ncbi:MAG: hypothetical protein ACTS4V_01650 [Candidatus Hodgkinia cicadicola]
MLRNYLTSEEVVISFGKETRTEVWFAIWLNNKIKLSCNGANLALALEELANGDC